MKKIFATFLLQALVVCSIAQGFSLTQTIQGIVVDEQSGSILSNVTVSTIGLKNNIASFTDSTGRFSLQHVPIGRQTIRASIVGYGETVISNIELTSSKEIVLEIKLKESINVLKDVVVSSTNKNRAINDLAVISARQLSMDEAVRYSGTRNDPSRMAQNFAGVSGTNDARNDIVIRGNSPSGVLWRMDGIDIPNPNHFSTVGATGGPVSMLNTNTLKNSDFITSAFPSQYGNAIAGVFDLRMRNGNSERYEYLGEMGFNGFEFGAEGPLNKKTKSSFLVDYRYSMVATLVSMGINVGTGSATPYYQDASFKFHINTKKAGVFDIFGLGGESHIDFPADDTTNNFYTPTDGIVRHSNDKSLTGVMGVSNTYFFNTNTSGKFIAAVSGFQSKFLSKRIITGKPEEIDNDINDVQNKISFGYTFNKKFNAKNQLTAGVLADIYFLNLREDYIPHGDSVLTTYINSKNTTSLIRGFVNYNHRFSNSLSTNIGVYSQLLGLNNTLSIEPRWNIRYQFLPNQSFSFGTGLHSQMQPLEVYFYQTNNSSGQAELTNKNLDFVKSLHFVAGYDISLQNHIRIKTEIYQQYIFNAAVESTPTSFSMLNYGADFGFPEKANLENKGKGHNYGVELTIEKFLHHGFYYLITGSLFQSKYKGSDDVWRNTAFNSNYVVNILGGKEFKLNEKSSFGIDTKFAVTGGQRYTPFDIAASQNAGYVIYKEDEAYNLQNNTYLRWDLKFSYTRNAKRITQKWYIDFQNTTNRKNLFSRTLNPYTGKINEIYQIGFFPNINYQITF